jgi:NNP family nitrate/nitrite transporter-like MFS transporter
MRPLQGRQPFLPNFFPILLLSGIFFFNFLSRIVLSPLLMAVERDLGLSHVQASRFFFITASGYSLAMLCSGFLSRKLTHRRMVQVSVFVPCAGLLCIGLGRSPGLLRAGLFVLGAGAGLYSPSGVAMLTALAGEASWGRATALHELAPNLGLIVAPLLAGLLLPLVSWQTIFVFLAAAWFCSGLVFVFWGRGGDFHGRAPDAGTLRLLLGRRSFWVFLAVFSLGAASELGVYALIPTYLVTARGLSEALVHRLVGMSRLANLGVIFAAGWLADRWGARRLLLFLLAGIGAATGLLALPRGGFLVAAVFVQPVLVAAFFPVVFAVLYRIIPPQLLNVSISLIMPAAYLFGAGVVPACLGWFAQRGLFDTGLACLGALIAAGILLLPWLRLEALKDRRKEVYHDG